MALIGAIATFTSTDTASVAFSPPLVSNPPKLLGFGVDISDGNGGVGVSVQSLTNAGCTIVASGAFTGSVSIIASD